MEEICKTLECLPKLFREDKREITGSVLIYVGPNVAVTDMKMTVRRSDSSA